MQSIMSLNQSLFYQKEHFLVNDFASCYSNQPGNDGSVKLIFEYNTNWGVVDLLIINYNKRVLEARYDELINYNHIENGTSKLVGHALSFLSHNSSISYAELGQFLNLRTNQTLKLVDLLVDRKLIYTYESKTIKLRAKEDLFFINSVYAVEAKLKNWRNAIAQAERHLWFTNHSFILIPELNTETQFKVRLQCQQKRLGLIIQQRSDSFKFLEKPTNDCLFVNYFLWKMNESLLDSMLDDNW